jgi:hypothetical protein
MGRETFDRTDWASALLSRVRARLAADSAVDVLPQSWRTSTHGPTVHMAVFVEPYLQYILDGRKTIESRFSVNRCPPYGRVREGDIVLLKRSGGPVYGICQVAQVWFYRLDRKSWEEIRENFSLALCAQDPQFWKDREAASFATLMRIKNVRSIDPIEIPKKDRRGWVFITTPLPSQLELLA